MNYLFLSIALGFWLLSLLAWLMNFIFGAAIFGSLTVVFILFQKLFQEQMENMFGKNRKMMDIPQMQVDPVPVVPEKPTQVDDKQNNTVISGDVRFEGNLVASGQVYIYGQVCGNIDAGDGMVKIMHNGWVNGDINCRELIIDGKVNGECRAEALTIDVHGNISGAIVYASLTVKKGAILVGKAENIAKTEKENTNVIGFIPENTAQNKDKIGTAADTRHIALPTSAEHS
ncbi:bactofilin family protein [Martelella alba]|uniref:Polymer-forming cytoskeletal protein n=1 Tax=Martelella alba TaxID=2590451 RepID=A0ABY2SU71_9HYPH|nr:polymer-forming cytoskeletal protein [Martelella alba]TKI07889.1 polymer-forming cytoskeletal protein [Martelella alba]